MTPAERVRVGAILIYLAEKTGKFLPTAPRPRIATLEWLMFQMGGIGPMLGQAHHFLKFNPGKAPYAEERYGAEAKRLYGVLDRRLGVVPYLAGDDSPSPTSPPGPGSPAGNGRGSTWRDFPNVRRWYVELAARPGVQRGYDVPAMGHAIPLPA